MIPFSHCCATFGDSAARMPRTIAPISHAGLLRVMPSASPALKKTNSSNTETTLTRGISPRNCRALLPGAAFPERHLSDAQIRAIAERGGVIGVNLFARFLVPAEELKAGRRAYAHDVVRHAEHIAQVAGRRDVVALGSDMESGFGLELMPVDVRGPGELVRIAEALSAAGWTDAEIDGFAWGNWEQRLPRGK